MIAIQKKIKITSIHNSVSADGKAPQGPPNFYIRPYGDILSIRI